MLVGLFSLPRMLGKNYLLPRFGFEILFRVRTFVFVVLLLPCVFRCCFAYVFCIFVGFSFPRMLGKNSLLLRFGFEILFRERTFVFVVLLCSSILRWCFAYVIFAYLLGFSFPRMLGNNFLPLRFGFEILVREQIFVFVVLLCSSHLVFFGGVLPTFLHICWVLLVPKILMCDFART